jgi:hypothetical protein
VIDVVWSRILAHAGEEFRLVRGARFTYHVRGNSVVPNRTDYPIHRSQFEIALGRMPLGGPSEIQDLRGPSYVFAILTDGRIRPTWVDGTFRG